MDKCQNCGKPIGRVTSYGECPGVVYMAPDPYRQELYSDDNDYNDCDGNRYESGRDV